LADKYIYESAQRAKKESSISVEVDVGQQDDHDLYSSFESPSNLRLSIDKDDESRKRNHAFKGNKNKINDSKSNQNSVNEGPPRTASVNEFTRN
jgi:hypothetical protein